MGKGKRVPVVACLSTITTTQINKLPENDEGNFKVIFFAEETQYLLIKLAHCFNQSVFKNSQPITISTPRPKLKNLQRLLRWLTSQPSVNHVKIRIKKDRAERKLRKNSNLNYKITPNSYQYRIKALLLKNKMSKV